MELRRPSEAVPARVSAERPKTQGCVLLLVDDAKRCARHAFLIRALKFECLEARDARLAVRMVEDPSGPTPNLVFIDLADDRQAVQASRRLKRLFDGTIPVLLSLTLNETPTQQRVAEAGADNCVVYPIDEVDLVFKLRTMMSHAKRVQELQQTNARLDALLRRHVGGPLVDRWLAGTVDDGNDVTGRMVTATVVFADINGFTRMSSEWPAERTVVLLNEILTLCTLPLVDYGGTVDKYIGDCVMAYFGPEEEQPEHATRAVRAAAAMRRSVRQWVHSTDQLDGDINLSVGINTGPVVLGNMGSSLRLDHTVIGDVVNVASRLQELAPDGCTYAGPETVRQTAYRFRWESRGKKKLRGRTERLEAYELVDEIVTRG